MKLIPIFLSAVICSLLVFAVGCNQSAIVAAGNNKNANAPVQPAQSDDIKRISLADAKKAFDAGTAIIIDSRPADSYNSEHIKGSINIPLSEIAKRTGELPKDKQLIFYCS